MPAQERRIAPRRSVRLSVRIWNENTSIEGSTRNLSKSGMFMDARTPPARGEHFHVEVTIADQTFLTECVVMRREIVSRSAQSIVPNGFGAQFVLWPQIYESVFSRSNEDEETNQNELTLDLTDPDAFMRALKEELSHGGLRIFGEATREVGELVDVVVMLPAPQDSVELQARVVSFLEDPQGLALELTDLQTARLKLGFAQAPSTQEKRPDVVVNLGDPDTFVRTLRDEILHGMLRVPAFEVKDGATVSALIRLPEGHDSVVVTGIVEFSDAVVTVLKLNDLEEIKERLGST